MGIYLIAGFLVCALTNGVFCDNIPTKRTNLLKSKTIKSEKIYE